MALFRLLLWLAPGLLPTAMFAAFGYTDNGTGYVVDSGAGLVFTVNKSSGDITSIVFDGVDYRSTTSKNSQLSSGLGTATVTPETDGSTYVKFTLQTGTSGTADPNMTHYLVVRNGDNTIYMATFPGQEPNVGELRWITRLNHALLPNGPEPSNLNNNTGAIESSDVFGLADGQTRSKYYGDASTHGKDRAMDLTYYGATGTNVGVWMIFGNRESSSGGPFFRDIENQAGTDQEIYNYMNSGHNQTEPYRLNVLHGPYALTFTHGEAPAYPRDFSWMGALNLQGWVPAAARGAVSGTATGIPAGIQGVVGFANATAQYWAVVAADGTYTCPGMKPGDYQVTLYKGELEVATSTVTVTAGSTTPLTLASTEATPAAIFRIGEWDGTPAGLLNGDKIPQMHPSDVRMAPWDSTSFTVGVDDPATFPAIQFRAKNSPYAITFTLAPNQVTDLTLRIGITCAYNSGRPQVSIGGWTSPAPTASSQPSSRSFTIGTYRGNNALYTFTIPASALVAGTNTLQITPISGSSDLGTWLSAGWVYDAVELDGPLATPVISYVGGSPLVISGTAEPGRTLTVLLDGSALGTTTVPAGGTWSFTPANPLPAGSHTLSAVASDSSGHASPASTAYAFDGSAAMPVITAAIGDTGTYGSGATTSDRVFTFTGTAAPGALINVTRVGFGSAGTATADASGHWTLDYTSVSLPDGDNAFYATAAAPTGNSASSPVFTLHLQGQPRVAITRLSPAADTIPNSVDNVVFRVTFNHTVNGVTTSAFAPATTGSATGHIASVSATSGSVFDVTVDGISGTGTLRVDLLAGAAADANGNPEPGYTAGEAYTLVPVTTGNGTWTRPTSGGRWGNALNWQNAVIADGAGSTADFSTLDTAGAFAVRLDTPRTVGTLAFGDADPSTPTNWLIDGGGNGANPLTLSGSAPSISVADLGTGGSTTIAAPLAGTGGFNKTGPGALVLTAASTITGPVNVNAGSLELATGGALSLGNNAVNTSFNATLAVTGGSFATSGLVSANSSAVIISGGSANLGSFRTNSDFGSALRVSGGQLTIGDVNVRRNSGAAPDFRSGFVVSGTATVSATTISLGTQNSTGAMSVEGDSAVTVSGPVTIGNQATGGRGGALRVIDRGTFTATDTAYGVILSRKNGSNANNVASATFSGGTSTVQKFTLGYDATVNAGSATLTLNGGTLYLGSGGIVRNGSTGFTSTLAFGNGTLGAAASWTTALPVTLPSGGNVNVRAADAASTAHDITWTGVVSGAGALTKTGGGTLTLDGGVTHSYLGATTINAGTLRVTSTLGTATNPVAVNASGTLAGNGIINRPIVLNAGGTLAPDGAPAAILTGTSLTWNAGGTVALDLGASGSSDLVALSGAFNAGTIGTYTFAFAPGAGFQAGNTYTLVTFSSTTFADASAFTATGLPDGTGALFQLRDTSLTIRIQKRPTVSGATTAAGTYGSPLTYTATADDLPVTFGATGLPPGLAIDSATGTISGTPTAAGDYLATVSATNTAGIGTAVVEFKIAKALAVVSVGTPTSSTLRATYDGNAKTGSVTTDPAGLNATYTYNGSTTPPTLPGTYAVVATINDPNYTGAATGTLVIGITALVQHAPTLNGELDGSIQVLTAENLTLNGNALVSGDVLVPGTPTVRLNGNPTLSAVHDAAGAATPANYTVTLNGNAMARYLVRRVDPIPVPVLAAVAAPTGTRDVTLNQSTDPLGDPTTIRDLTLNGGLGAIALPPGAYRNLTANSGGFVLGVAGAIEPAVYNIQRLTLNGSAQLQVVGPVILRLANGVTFNGNGGSGGDASLLTLELPTGGVTLNGAATLSATVTAPNGSVVINGSAVLNGSVVADRLTINGSGALIQSP